MTEIHSCWCSRCSDNFIGFAGQARRVFFVHSPTATSPAASYGTGRCDRAAALSVLADIGLSSRLAVLADDNGVPPAASATIEAGPRLTNIDDPVTRTIALRGPGDVLRLEGGTVTKTMPAPGARDCAPNFFPYVEFADPELPWLYTPARPGPTNRLMPWLCLIAVEEGPEIVLSSLADPPVMRLSIASGAGQRLPPLTEAHAWAHLQDVEGAQGPRTVARLLSPMRLKPRAQYTACLVPTFEAGRLAGLGRDADPSGPLLAWQDGTAAQGQGVGRGQGRQGGPDRRKDTGQDHDWQGQAGQDQAGKDLNRKDRGRSR